MDTDGRKFKGDPFVSIRVYSWFHPVWAGWNNREWTLMDANLRETHSCRFAFIRGSNPVLAGWNNREWTLMDANLRRTHSCRIRVHSWFQPSPGRLE